MIFCQGIHFSLIQLPFWLKAQLIAILKRELQRKNSADPWRWCRIVPVLKTLAISHLFSMTIDQWFYCPSVGKAYIHAAVHSSGSYPRVTKIKCDKLAPHTYFICRRNTWMFGDSNPVKKRNSCEKRTERMGKSLRRHLIQPGFLFALKLSFLPRRTLFFLPCSFIAIYI